MRWVTFRTSQGERVGVVVDDQIHTLPPGNTLMDLIALGADGLREIGEEVQRSPADVLALADADLAAPIPRPPAIRDFLCFLDHVRNCQRTYGGSRVLKDVWYRIPAFYFANPATVLGPYDDAPIAPGSAWQDFELEIGAVIGIGGKDLTVTEAERAIIGYTIFNDWSARDLQGREMQMNIGQGKGKDGGTTLGPYLVTPDELAPYLHEGRLAVRVMASVNGKVIGSGTTGAMDWSFPEVVAYASRGVPLRAGDVFGSGTVPSCTLLEHLNIATMNEFQGWLHDGDVVTLDVQGLGVTRQTVRASALPHPLSVRQQPGAKPPVRSVNRAPAAVPYTRGLHSIGDQVWAWTLPEGELGRSNAGLVSGDGAALLIDTLFDLRLTAEMLTAMEPVTAQAPIRWALMTHSNGDHTHGNQLLDLSVRIVAAKGTAEEVRHGLAGEMYASLTTFDLGPVVTPYLRDRLGLFDFGGITVRNADETFESQLTVDVGGRRVELINLGPAHTAADSVAYVPDAGVVYAGDLVFAGGAPIVWAGPIANWVAACDAMLALDPTVVVPGHGPVGGPESIQRMREYLVFVSEYAESAHKAGLPFREAADRIDLGGYRDWLDAERVAANVYQRYRELDPSTEELGAPEIFALLAEWHAKNGEPR